MSAIETGGPAFPMVGHIVDGEWETHSQFTGMTMRDYFAAKAMQALIATQAEVHLHTEEGTLVVPARKGIPPLAYEYADAMLKAREAK